MALLEKRGGVLVFKGRRHAGRTLEEVAREDPGYLHWVFTRASHALDDDAYYALEGALRRANEPR